jgi:hypothetical protein
MWRQCAVMALMLVCGSAAPSAKTASSISHGSEVKLAIVGPSAAGYASRGDYPGGEIRDSMAMPFARKISEPATYDGFTVAGPHLLVEGVVFTSALDVYVTLPIVFRGVSVRVQNPSHWAIHTRPGAGPFYFLWSEAGAVKGQSAAGSTALLLRGNSAVVYRSHISNSSDGIHTDATTAIVRENLIDGLVTHPGDHNDAIQTAPQARGIVIERNRIHNVNAQTSCIYNSGSDVTVRDNYLAGGGWVIYGGGKDNGHGGGGARNVSVMGNIFGADHFPKSGNFGPVAYWDKANTWSGNRYPDGSEIAP